MRQKVCLRSAYFTKSKKFFVESMVNKDKS